MGIEENLGLTYLDIQFIIIFIISMELGINLGTIKFGHSTQECGEPDKAMHHSLGDNEFF